MKNPLSRELTAAEYYQHLNSKQVMEIIGASSYRTVWKYVSNGKLPKPRYISPHRPVWRLGEVVEHFGKQLEEFEAAPRSYKGDPKLEEAVPKQKVRSSAADRLRERLGIGRKR